MQQRRARHDVQRQRQRQHAEWQRQNVWMHIAEPEREEGKLGDRVAAYLLDLLCCRIPAGTFIPYDARGPPPVKIGNPVAPLQGRYLAEITGAGARRIGECDRFRTAQRLHNRRAQLHPVERHNAFITNDDLQCASLIPRQQHRNHGEQRSDPDLPRHPLPCIRRSVRDAWLFTFRVGFR